MIDLEELMRNPISRRAFLARMTAAGLGGAALALLSGCGGDSSTSSNFVDPTNFPGVPGRSINEVVLNYALTLEILEANLYLQGLNKASGRALTSPLAADPTVYALAVGPGGLTPQFAQTGFNYLVQFAYVEAAHRDFLTAALGSVAVSANAKGYKFATPTGDPGGDIQTILSNILPLEETGVRAYLGAVPFLTDLTLAQTAGTIYSTEARHSASIEYILGLDPGPRSGITGVPAGEKEVAANPPSANTFEKYLPPATVLQAAKAAFFVL